MGYYRPRPTEVKTCKHCRISFETNHKRTLYCGESCRQLAYQARHRADEVEPSKAKGNLSFSLQNVGVVATGATAVAVGNYLFNDKPAQQAFLSKLDSIEKGTEQGLTQLIAAAQFTIDYINAQIQNDFSLKTQIDQIQAKRIQEKSHRKQSRQQAIANILAKKGL